jgi:hypothetical protein
MLWDETPIIKLTHLPSTGTINAELSGGTLGGADYARAAPERIKSMLY